MNTTQNINAITEFLTEDNYRRIEREFLKHTQLENYQDDQFDADKGVTLEWGKYGYSATEEEQQEDIEMLNEATVKFNNEFIGKFIAFAEEEDKYNCVYLMDMKQLSQHYQYKDDVEYYTSAAHKKAFELIQQNFR